MGNPVHVAWIFDHTASLEASVAITSIVANADPKREYALHLLVLNVSSEHLTALLKLRRRNIHIDVRPLDATSFPYPKFEYPKQIRLERIALGRHLHDISRVVYLDTDLVARRDIAELYDIDLGGRPIGAVVDLHIQRQFILGRIAGGRSDLRSYFENTLSISGDMQKSYFNTGMLILDLDYMRKHKIEERARKILDSSLELMIPDQCVVNMLMLSQARLVDSRWNVLVPSTRLSLLIKRTAADKKRRQDLSRPYILHFAGGKPWRHRSRPKASYWWAYAMASPLRREIIASFWTSRGRSMLSTIRSKALAPMQIAIALGRSPYHPRTKLKS
jgi:lipopolysaccharide biosynthesis glycosyltransferase